MMIFSLFIVLTFTTPNTQATDRIHAFSYDGQSLVFKTNDFMAYLQPNVPLYLRVVFWKKGIVAPFTVERGEIRVARWSPFALTNIRVNDEGSYMVQFHQTGQNCPVNYYFTFHKDQVPIAQNVVAQRNCQ